ncbi:MAG: asparagine synthase (glutamine-hydrolyzing), partial [Deltaproteobacteria bacterium]|nr:asparagine synthase (glutamine-hydrolyzing) [Deltaproteobacteria bacterium]
WGPSAVERFNGQFAIALWDRTKRRFLLARDRVGIRPLYYAKVSQRLYFASEVKSLLQAEDVPRRLDPRGLAHVFGFWGPVAPRTVFEDIEQLPPGTFALAEEGRPLKIQRYWQPRFREPREEPYASPARIRDLAVALRDTLEEATKLRMLRADVPVGVYISGGIDSSVIGSLVRRFHQGNLRTFSLRFAHKDFDERDYQRQMVDRLGTEHVSVEVDYKDIAEAFYDAVWFAEAPMLRAAPAPLFLLSRLVREHGYKVVLTGEGSDEFLAGYDIFREDRVRRFWAKDPTSKIRPALLGALYPWLTRSPAQAKALGRTFFGKGMDRIDRPWFSHIPRWESAQALQRIFRKERHAELEGFDAIAEVEAQLPPEIDTWEPLGKAQSVEIVTLLSSYLLSTQGDRMLMGNSVEGRFPFLDPNVIDLANALPPEAKLHVLDEKHLLKQAAKDLLPASILQRPKQPYRAPDAQSFVQDDAPAYIAEVTSEEAIEAAGVFHPKGVARLFAKMQRMRDKTPSNADNMAVVGILSTQLLDRFFIRGEGPAISVPEHLDTWTDRLGEKTA